MAKFPVPAGEGDTEIYPIYLEGGAERLFQKDEHYIRISASSVFVNKQGGWFSKKSVTGLVSIAVGAQAPLQVALNCYDLDGGQRRAPFTNKELMPATKYGGGNIFVAAQLNGIKRDTSLSVLLKSMAEASLGIVSGIVVAPSSQSVSPLHAASGALVNGVRDIIADHSKDKDFSIFDPHGGLSDTIEGASLKGDEFFALLHRGSKLDRAKLSIHKEAHVEYVHYEGRPLEDGAWILLQINRLASFPVDRPWKKDYHGLRDELGNLISDVFDLQSRSLESAKAEFAPSSDDRKSLHDKFVALRNTIQKDEALIPGEIRDTVATMTQVFVAAKNAIGKNDRSLYDRLLDEMRSAAAKGISAGTQKALDGMVSGGGGASGGETVAARGKKSVKPASNGAFPLEHLLERASAMSFFERP